MLTSQKLLQKVGSGKKMLFFCYQNGRIKELKKLVLKLKNLLSFACKISTRG